MRIKDLHSSFSRAFSVQWNKIVSRIWGSVTDNNGFWNGWLDLLAHLIQLQSVMTALNQSSTEPFFLDRRSLSPFCFSFYNWLQTTFVDPYNTPARTMHRKHIENTVSKENVFALPSNGYSLLLTRRLYRYIVQQRTPYYCHALKREGVYRVVAQQRICVIFGSC
jgi:hypothetical protein